MPDREIAEVQNVRFSTTRRGYDRDQVHDYMQRVNTLLAELQITASPEYAIKAAIEKVRDERRSVIADAEREAEEITRRSRAQADDRVQEAEREAHQLRDAAIEEAEGSQAAAETRIRLLQDEVRRMMEQRDRAVEELAKLSQALDELLERNGENGSGRTAPEPAHAGQ